MYMYVAYYVLLLTGLRLKSPTERDNMIIDTLNSLGRYQEASPLLVSVIESDPDCWSAIKAYVHGARERARALYREPLLHNGPASQSPNDSESNGEEKTPEQLDQEGAPSNQLENGETPSNQSPNGEAPNQSTDEKAPSNSADEALVKAKPWLKPLVEARDLLEKLVSEELKEGGDFGRGPLLGKLELVKVVRELKDFDVPILLGEWLTILLSYHEYRFFSQH